MPNGYTDQIYEGKDTSFRGFMLRCARAFLIDQRDESPDAAPRRMTADAYHTERVREAQKEVDRYLGMTLPEADREQRDKKVERDKRRAEDATRRAEIAARYNNLINELNEWEAAPQLADLKAFMLEQLRKSIKWDCEGYSLPEVELVDPVTYLNGKRAEANKNLGYARAQLIEHQKQVDKHNEFVDALYYNASA